MDSCGFFIRNPWIVDFLIPIFTFACGNLTMFIITGLIMGSSACVLLTHTKQNLQVGDHEDQHHYQEDEFDLINPDHEASNSMSNVVTKGCFNVGSPDTCYQSEIIGRFSYTTGEDSDVDVFQLSGEGTCQITDCSDGSISDEESLIEIELLGGHYVGYKNCKGEEEPKFRRQMSSDSVLQWTEMYEEDNMIEIDISMGSIKCSRCEIKA